MMYNFVDTTGQPGTGMLPAEAICINGVWLDRVLEGSYRTLSVSGRELLPVEAAMFQVGKTDGSRVKNVRIPERILTVQYQILADDVYSFRETFQTLNEYLHVENAQIIFADEPDRYFIGTPLTEAEIPESGRLNVVSTFEILCADPFRYSVHEYEETADANGNITIEYDGTYRAKPVLMVVSASDMGAVTFIDDAGHIIQIGDPDESDTESSEMSETVLNDSFISAMPSGWQTNAIVALEPDVSTYQQIGTVKRTSEGLTADSYGSYNRWHGVTVKKELAQDSNGHAGAANCTVTWDFRFWASSIKRQGELMLYLIGDVEDSEKIIASYHVYKPHTSDGILWIYLYVNGKQKKRLDLSAAQAKSMAGQSGIGIASIAKFGRRFSFNFCGTSYEYEDADLEEVEVNKVAMFFEQYGTNQPMDHSFVRSVKAVSHGVAKWEDIPNKFAGGDVIVADTASGQISVNGIAMYGLGAIGNEWEGFTLEPGINNFKCAWSDWADSPSVNIRYRKVWL